MSSLECPSVVGHRFEVCRNRKTVSLSKWGLPAMTEQGWGVFHLTEINGLVTRKLLLTVARLSTANRIQKLFVSGVMGECGGKLFEQFINESEGFDD